MRSSSSSASRPTWAMGSWPCADTVLSVLLLILGVLLAGSVYAHGIGGSDAAFVAGAAGTAVGPFMYLGAKHMVTGYDHLLFIFATIFLLYRAGQVALYVTLFSLGHSITLLFGTLGNVHVDAYLIDAVIGLSVVYKAFDNLGGFQAWFGRAPNQKLAIFIFGLFHGFGLATKLQELHPSRVGLVQNILAFNAGVELGQLLALFIMFGLIVWWRRQAHFQRMTLVTNTVIMACGFTLMGYQLTQYFLKAA